MGCFLMAIKPTIMLLKRKTHLILRKFQREQLELAMITSDIVINQATGLQELIKILLVISKEKEQLEINMIKKK